MPYVNSRLCALFAMGLSLLAAPGLHAQEASVSAAALRGDVDGDGRVTPADAEAVRAYLVRGTLPGGRSIMPAGDANGDGRVTAADAALISRFAAGVDVSRFPVGRPVSEGGGRTVPSQGAMIFTEYECGADPRTRVLVCEMVRAGGEGGARYDVLLFGSGAQIVPKSPTTYVAGATHDTMKVTVAVRNLLKQPIGTTDGVTADTVRVVFTGYRTTAVSSLPLSAANVVTADGTATFTDSVNGGSPVSFPNRQYMDFPELIAPNATSDEREVRIAYQKGLTGDFKFQYRIWSRVQYQYGNITFAPADSIIGAGQTVDLDPTSYSVIGASLGTEAVTWQSSNESVATVSSAGVVTGMAGGTTTITATSNVDNRRAGTRVIRVIQANPETVDVTGNVRVSAGSVLTNDSIHPPVSIAFVGWNGTPNASQQGGQVAMNTTPGPGYGTFTYNPPAGFDGTDSVAYTITSGAFAVDTGKVALTVEDMIWFVRNGGDPCTSRAAGCGRLLTPYSSLNAFRAENNGTGDNNNPEAGDAIFLYESATPHTLTGAPLTLLENQKLIGQDAGAPLASIANITLAAGSDALPGMNPGADATTIGGTVGGVVLGANNLLRGFGISTTGGVALEGTNFGTPTITEVPVSATNGQALRLDGGAANSTSFPTVTSTGSPKQGVSLRSITGTLTITAGSIADADSAALLVSGGDVTLTWPGGIDQTNNAPLVDVGSHAGTLAFPGALTANNGSGLQFNSAQGVYTFSGTATLAGTDAGIDITNGSGGTFTFGTGTQITNSAGTGLNVYGSAPTGVTYSGSITKSGTNAGRLVEIGEMTGGTVTFAAGSTLNSSSTLGTGISLSNVDGTVNFNGTNTLSGGDAGVDVLSNSTGTIAFSATSSISNPSGIAFFVNGSSPTSLTYPGTITANSSRAVEVSNGANAACGTVSFSGNLAGSGASASGILVNRCNAGTITFSGASKSFSTQANPAVTISNNGAAVDFTNGGLAITTTTNTGTGFSASGGGSVRVTGSGNTINAAAAAALLVDGVTLGSGGLEFQRIDAGGGTNGVRLVNAGSAGVLVTGTGTTAGSGGTVTGSGGDAVVLNATSNVTLKNMNIGDAAAVAGQVPNAVNAVAGDGLDLTNADNVLLNNVKVARTGGHGMDGTGVTNLTIQNSSFLNSGDANEENALTFNDLNQNNLDGTVSITGTVFDGFTEAGIDIENFSGTLNMTVAGSTFANNTSTLCAGSTCGEQGILAIADGTATLNLTVNGNTLFNGVDGNAIHVSSEGTSTTASTVNVTQSTIQNSTAIGIVLFGGTGDHTSTIQSRLNFNLGTGLSVTGSKATAISIQPNGKSIMRGTVSGVTVNGSQVGRGIEVLSDDVSDAVVSILNNTVSNTAFNGIFANNGDAGKLDIHIRNNTVSAPLDGSPPSGLAVHGIEVNPLAEAATTCLDIAANTSAGNAASGGAGFRTRQRDPAVFQMERLPAASATSAAAVASFLQAQNTSGTGSATVNTGYTAVADGFCRDP